MRRLLKFGLFLLPVFIIPITINGIKINIRDARELFFQSLMIVGLALLIKNKWIKGFLVWATVSWWFNYFLPPQSTAVLFNIFFGFFLFYLIREFVNFADIDGILKIVCLTALFQVFWMGIQLVGKDPFWHPITCTGARIFDKPVHIVGWLGNTNILGAYLAFCLLLFRVYFKKFILFILAGLIVTRSTTAVIAAFSGLMCFEFFTAKDYKKLIKLFLISIGVLILFFVFIEKTDNLRFEVWRKLLAQTFNWRCLIGQGLGRFQNLRIVHQNTVWDNPHNEYLNIYFELGIVGLVFVFGYLLGLFRRFLKYKTDKSILLFSCIMVVLVESLGMFPFQVATTAFLAITYFALLEKCLHHQNILLES